MTETPNENTPTEAPDPPTSTQPADGPNAAEVLTPTPGQHYGDDSDRPAPEE